MCEEVNMSDLCEEWSDDERMKVMFAPLRSKELNPESWNSKIQFWSSLIKKHCEGSRQCSFTIRQLETVFARDGVSPHCLAQVLTELTNSGEILDARRYVSQLRAASSWSSWVSSFGWRAVQVVNNDKQ